MNTIVPQIILASVSQATETPAQIYEIPADMFGTNREINEILEEFALPTPREVQNDVAKGKITKLLEVVTFISEVQNTLLKVNQDAPVYSKADIAVTIKNIKDAEGNARVLMDKFYNIKTAMRHMQYLVYNNLHLYPSDLPVKIDMWIAVCGTK